ncbi:uncharacterized protein CC84DRAFT_981693 [Paraphaeosphaeria sporulosa]|uniref:Uncharacterized protein n=1 Tax=Paraphaeosphaeria sporulosa TaxID=1460663 RepID=A0A177C350_9PLEO|nr:uncharacterized protein CC84DRAFT_981693 [Paraphaeosphaeria sporulosa]OAG02043.1 hypothetical protein CC84DRAFT_981693 [Paraphaeosphaeria sporulosa]
MVSATGTMLVPKFKIQHFVAGAIAEFTPIPGILLRFAILIPLGLCQSVAKTHWKAIGSYPKLRDAYSLQIRAGEHMAFKWSQVNFCYHLAALIPSTFLLSPVNIIFAIPDVVLLTYLSLAITSQESYSPKNMDCQDPTSLSNPVFLQAAASLGLLMDVERACEEFKQQRNFAVVTCALVASMVFFNICNCFFACVRLGKEVNSSKISHSQLPIWKQLLPTLMLPFREFMVLCFWILLYVPCLTFRRFPASVQSRVLFAMRCRVKSFQGRFQQRKPAQCAQTDHNGAWMTALQGKNTDAPLAEFLCVYDVLVMVTTHLHYVDITNLSLVSRRIHKTLLPAKDAPSNFLRTYSCNPGFKARCYVCPNQICNGCLFRREVKKAQLFYDHLFHCLPHCSKCYLRTLREPRVDVHGPAQIDTRQCACRHPTASTVPQFLQRLFHSSGNDAHGILEEGRTRGGPLLVCRTCNQLSDAELAAIGTRRLKGEMRSRVLTRSDLKGVADSKCCSGCRKVLRKGARWWICESCNKECRSRLHRL